MRHPQAQFKPQRVTKYKSDEDILTFLQSYDGRGFYDEQAGCWRVYNPNNNLVRDAAPPWRDGVCCCLRVCRS